MSLGALLARMEPRANRFAVSAAEGWLQGRTMYGGASTLLAYAAALRARPDLPALRGAQVGFVAPVGADVEIAVETVREGRSVTQIGTEMFGDGGLVHRGLWLFGAARPTNGTLASPVATGFVPVDEAEPVPPRAQEPQFLANFEMRRPDPKGAERPGTIRRWMRLRDAHGLDPIATLVGMGDALPPGSVRAMDRPGPISSINWSFTLLGDHPRTREGWWLLETASNHMADGFSSETLRMWNSDGIQVMHGLQSVAIFG